MYKNFLDQIKYYLPKFLSQDSYDEMFVDIKIIMTNIESYDNYYSSKTLDDKIIYQGDGLRDVIIANLPSTETRKVPVMVFSNTCDIDLNNNRLFSSRIFYAPIFNLNKYKNKLIQNIAIDSNNNTELARINNHIENIKKQRISQALFLPKKEGVIDDSIVFLDRISNMPSKCIQRGSLNDRRIFTLSNSGFYLFLLKLSIHLTRIRDGVER